MTIRLKSRFVSPSKFIDSKLVPKKKLTVHLYKMPLDQIFFNIKNNV
jgi:hypothetical protein